MTGYALEMAWQWNVSVIATFTSWILQRRKSRSSMGPGQTIHANETKLKKQEQLNSRKGSMDWLLSKRKQGWILFPVMLASLFRSSSFDYV